MRELHVANVRTLVMDIYDSCDHCVVFPCAAGGDDDVTETERDEPPPLDSAVTAGWLAGILHGPGPGLRSRAVHGQGARTMRLGVETAERHTCPSSKLSKQ